MNVDAHALLRRFVPRPVRHSVRHAQQAAHRVSAWMQVWANMRGVGADDQETLRASLNAAPCRIFDDLAHWREPTLIADATLFVRGHGRFRVRGGSDDLGHLVPTNFRTIRRIVEQRLGPGDVAIDAGANIGAVAVAMARAVGTAGRVVAVEMMPDTAACLRANLLLNDARNTTVVEAALASQAGQIVRANVRPGYFGQASIIERPPAGEIDVVEVRTTTLDEVAAGLGAIGLVKMDLEGAEPAALRGATSMLARASNVLFEAWEPDGGEAASILRGAGFAIAKIDGRNFLATRR